MLPSKGLSRSNPASALRTAWSCRTQSARTLHVPRRQFSQAQSRSTLLSSPSRGPYSTPISLSTTVAASGVFAQRSGASRNLSLWPFSSKQKPPEPTEPQSASPTSVAPPEPKHSTPAAPESTSAAPTPQDVSPSIPAEPVDLTVDYTPDIDLISVLDIPEQIGYLKHLGLDYGLGPTACCEWFVEHLYIYTGLPWWATLAAAAFAWRAVFFVPTLIGSRHQSLLAELNQDPAYLKAKAEMEEAAWKTRDYVAQRQARTKMMMIKQSYGAKYTWSFISIWTIPFSYGMFRLVRGMASMPVPSMETGGFAWFTDLTIPDPYYILPAASIGLAALMFKQGRDAALTPPNPATEFVNKGMMYFLPPVMFLATAWLPAGIQWFFFVFSLGSVAQTAALLNPAIRRWSGIPPLKSKGTLMPIVPGARWQAPTTPNPAPADDTKKSVGDTAKSFLGIDKQKEEWKRAQEYEERRAQEEKEKAFRRIEEARRRRAEKGRA
ncbi:60Kd inner membrane protein-domain-containing protein [Jackrogersella minutella]|nr:60Kd inner membrane protein-domain-containing protein [Jackrogersella minutella]